MTLPIFTNESEGALKTTVQWSEITTGLIVVLAGCRAQLVPNIMYVYMSVCQSVSLSVCLYVCTCMYVCVAILHIHTYIYIYIMHT